MISFSREKKRRHKTPTVLHAKPPVFHEERKIDPKQRFDWHKKCKLNDNGIYKSMAYISATGEENVGETKHWRTTARSIEAYQLE